MARTTTSRRPSAADNLKDQGERTAMKAAYSPAMELLARVGYAVRGVLYVTIGAIALQAAIGKSSSPADQIGAIATVGHLAGGHILLWVMFIGLAAYALWGLVRAIFDPFHKGSDTSGLAARAGYVISAISYAFLSLTTYGLIRGTGSQSSTTSTIQFVTKMMEMPAGRTIVAIIGIAVLIGGLYQIYAAVNENFEQRFKPYALTAEERKTAIEMGKIGTAVRGLVIGIVGFFLILAATSADPARARGFDGALKYLGQQPYGIYLLGVVAVGLIFLGLYSLMAAAWFRLQR